MFSFIIMLSTLSCLLPYLFSSLVEVSLCMRQRIPCKRKGLITAGAIALPAFLYAAWAITGLESEVLLWGAILLSAGIPVFAYSKYLSKKP